MIVAAMGNGRRCAECERRPRDQQCNRFRHVPL
jgi:hypothetical protein